MFVHVVLPHQYLCRIMKLSLLCRVHIGKEKLGQKQKKGLNRDRERERGKIHLTTLQHWGFEGQYTKVKHGKNNSLQRNKKKNLSESMISSKLFAVYIIT